MKNKVGIIGAFSTGKTTLINELENELKDKGYSICKNKERILAKELNLDFNKATKEEIKNYQNKLLNILYDNHTRTNKLLTDNPIHLGYAYSKLNGFETCSNKILNIIKNEVLYDVLFYVPIEFKIEDDGIRHIDKDFQKAIDKEIQFILKQEKNAKIITITGTIEERIKKIKKHLV